VICLFFEHAYILSLSILLYEFIPNQKGILGRPRPASQKKRASLARKKKTFLGNLAENFFFKGGNFQVFNIIFKGAIFNFSFQNHIKVKNGGKARRPGSRRERKNEEWKTRMKSPQVQDVNIPL